MATHPRPPFNHTTASRPQRSHRILSAAPPRPSGRGDRLRYGVLHGDHGERCRHGGPGPSAPGSPSPPATWTFILKQIKIAERHAATLTPADPLRHARRAPARDQIPDALTLVRPAHRRRLLQQPHRRAGETFARRRPAVPAADQPGFRDAGADHRRASGRRRRPTSYAQKTGNVVRLAAAQISNLIVDQTSTNPAAVAAAGFPVRTQGNAGSPVHDRSRPDGRPAGRRRAGRLHAVAPHPVHPERDDRRRPLAAVQLAVHVLRPVLRPRRRPDRQERRHGLRPAQGRRPADRRPDRSSATATTCRPSQRFMVLTRAQNQPGPRRTIRGHAPTTSRTPTTPTRPGSTRARPTPRTPRTRCSCASTSIDVRPAGPSRPASCSAAARPATPTAPRRHDRHGDVGATKTQAADLLGLQLQDKDVTEHPDARRRPVRQVHPRPDTACRST